MSDKLNVAIFPCGSEVGLEIHRALKYYRHFKLIGLNSIEDKGEITFENYIGSIPFISDNNFIEKLQRIIIDQNIKFIIPAMDEAGFVLKSNESKLNCEVVYPSIEVAKVLRRKSLMYDKLSAVIKTPEVYYSKEEVLKNLPVFEKPDIGYGSRGASKITDQNAHSFIYKKENIYTELLTGAEYTIDCFSDKQCKLLFSGARERSRVRMGISVRTKHTADQDKFREVAQKIGTHFNLSGVWFFQLKEDSNGDLCLLEVAGRVSGSMALYRGQGVNFIAMDLFQRLGNKVSILEFQNNDLKMERSFDCKIVDFPEYDHIYCDLDDCLIINNKVNDTLLAFLYKSRGQDKKITLLSRHKHDVLTTLAHYRIHKDLFDELLVLSDETQLKSDFIRATSKSLFIDDSFKERSDVQNHTNAIVIAPDVIDLLI